MLPVIVLGSNYKSVNLSQEANGKRAKFDCSDSPCKDKHPFGLVMQMMVI